MRKCLKEQIEKFINKSKDLKELENKRDDYERELKEIKEKIVKLKRQ